MRMEKVRDIGTFKRVLRNYLQGAGVDYDTVARDPDGEYIRVSITAAGNADASKRIGGIMKHVAVIGERANYLPERCLVDITDTEADGEFRCHIKREWLPDDPEAATDEEWLDLSERINESLRER
jgi:hypothetical protein